MKHNDAGATSTPIPTKEEDSIIVAVQEKLGNRLAEIARELPGRADNAIMNHLNNSLCKHVMPGQATAPMVFAAVGAFAGAGGGEGGRGEESAAATDDQELGAIEHRTSVHGRDGDRDEGAVGTAKMLSAAEHLRSTARRMLGEGEEGGKEEREEWLYGSRRACNGGWNVGCDCETLNL